MGEKRGVKDENERECEMLVARRSYAGGRSGNWLLGRRSGLFRLDSKLSQHIEAMCRSDVCGTATQTKRSFLLCGPRAGRSSTSVCLQSSVVCPPAGVSTLTRYSLSVGQTQQTHPIASQPIACPPSTSPTTCRHHSVPSVAVRRLSLVAYFLIDPSRHDGGLHE